MAANANIKDIQNGRKSTENKSIIEAEILNITLLSYTL